MKQIDTDTAVSQIMTSPNLVKNSHIKSDQFKHLNLLRIISAHAQRNKSFSAHDTAHCRKKLFGIAWPAKCLGRIVSATGTAVRRIFKMFWLLTSDNGRPFHGFVTLTM